MLDVVMHTFNASTREGETGRSLWVPDLVYRVSGQPGLHVRPCLKDKGNRKALILVEQESKY